MICARSCPRDRKQLGHPGEWSRLQSTIVARMDGNLRRCRFRCSRANHVRADPIGRLGHLAHEIMRDDEIHRPFLQQGSGVRRKFVTDEDRIFGFSECLQRLGHATVCAREVVYRCGAAVGLDMSGQLRAGCLRAVVRGDALLDLEMGKVAPQYPGESPFRALAATERRRSSSEGCCWALWAGFARSTAPRRSQRRIGRCLHRPSGVTRADRLSGSRPAGRCSPACGLPG